MIPSITSILSIQDYKVKCMINNLEIVEIDFYNWIHERSKDNNIYKCLKEDLNLFKTIQCDGETLYWPDLARLIKEDGSSVPANYDLDPLVLYGLAYPVELHV